MSRLPLLPPGWPLKIIEAVLNGGLEGHQLVLQLAQDFDGVLIGSLSYLLRLAASLLYDLGTLFSSRFEEFLIG